MTTLFQPLNETQKNLHELYRHMYLHGGCGIFALALHHGLGWPLFGLMKGKEICHAVVRSPDGKFFDVRGPITEKEIGIPYNLKPPHKIRPVTEDEVKNMKPLHDAIIEHIMENAEIIFPDLPWKFTGFTARVRKFVDELEKLSRKHGCWIRSPIPTQLPVITPEFGEEAGYEVSCAGYEFTLDRHLKKRGTHES
ncbi:hypothetical protein ACFL3E_00930 [Patescibacteria group bacterium]